MLRDEFFNFVKNVVNLLVEVLTLKQNEMVYGTRTLHQTREDYLPASLLLGWETVLIPLQFHCRITQLMDCHCYPEMVPAD